MASQEEVKLGENKQVKKIKIFKADDLQVVASEGKKELFVVESEMKMKDIYQNLQDQQQGIKRFLLKEKKKFILPYEKKLSIQSLEIFTMAEETSKDKLKLVTKWKKRVNYNKLFDDLNYFLKPENWFPVLTVDILDDVIDSMEQEDCKKFCQFFELDSMLQSSTKENLRNILKRFLKPLLEGTLGEDDARAILGFKIPLFLSPSSSSGYIGNLWEKKNIKSLSDKPLIVKILAILEICAKSDNITDIHREIIKYNNMDDLRTWTEKLDSLEIDTTSIITKLNGEKKEEFMKNIVTGVKNILKIEGQRSEFHPDIRKKAWAKCKQLKLSKKEGFGIIHEMFRVDMYGGIISLISTSGSPTGIQLDHIFPDNLGGLNTLENAANIHWRANNLKSDTPKEFLSIIPDGKDWFDENTFIKCVKLYGVFCTIGRTPMSLNESETLKLQEIEQKIKSSE